MDDSELKKLVQKGDQAKRVLETHSDYWKAVEADIIVLWCNSPSGEKELREDLYREYHGIQAIKAKIQKSINQGLKAQEELRQRKDGNRNST